MISNLNGSGFKFKFIRFGFTEKKRFLPVRGSGSGSVRLPGNNIYKKMHFGYHAHDLKNQSIIYSTMNQTKSVNAKKIYLWFFIRI